MSDLLHRTLDAHGGLERWNRLTSITASVTARGALFAAKGYPSGLGTVQASADLTTPRLAYTPFATAAHGLFEPDRVTTTDTDGTKRQRKHPRSAFADLANETPWDELHLLYFTGYAMWNYLCAPFLLTWPGVTCEEVEPLTAEEHTWRRLRANFPPNIPTHCAAQTFYFDETGLLRRVDYIPEIVGTGTAAHYCHNYQEMTGMLIPTQRRVYPSSQDGTPDTELTAVALDLNDIVAT